MILWVLIFLAIAIISFLLTFRSMRHYREKPDNFKIEYSVFLIQNYQNLNSAVLEKICAPLLEKQLIMSFEKLHKGSRSALVIYAPKAHMQSFTQELNLIELEDYSNKLQHFVSCWEVGEKPNSNQRFKNEKVNFKLDSLTNDEQVWWQVVVQPSLNKSSGMITFKSCLRLLMQSPNQHHLNTLNHQILTDLEAYGLSYLPQVYSIHQLVKFYKERAFGGSFLHSNQYITNLDIKSLENLIN